MIGKFAEGIGRGFIPLRAPLLRLPVRILVLPVGVLVLPVRVLAVGAIGAVRAVLRLLTAADRLDALAHILFVIDGRAAGKDEEQDALDGRQQRAQHHHPDVGIGRVLAEDADVDEDEGDEHHEAEDVAGDLAGVEGGVHAVRQYPLVEAPADHVVFHLKIGEPVVEGVGVIAEHEAAAGYEDELCEHGDDADVFEAQIAEFDLAAQFADQKGIGEGKKGAPEQLFLPLLFGHDKQSRRLAGVQRQKDAAGDDEGDVGVDREAVHRLRVGVAEL